MDSYAAIEKLRELQAARGSLDEYEVARRAAAILDRSDLRELDLTDYLVERGLSGHALASFTARFTTRVASLYLARNSVRPLKRLRFIAELKNYRPVNAYIEHDRDLFDRAFRELTADYSELSESFGLSA
jgi:hypothetical protein